MLILTIRTDKPEAEIGLYNDDTQLGYHTWQAHRELSAGLLKHIVTLLEQYNKQLEDVEGIVVFQGPGSFTGLRIGLTVANAVAYGLPARIVASLGERWIEQGTTRLRKGEDDHITVPHYGADAHITLPRH